MLVFWDEEALTEADAAAKFYQQRQVGLGKRFLDIRTTWNGLFYRQRTLFQNSEATSLLTQRALLVHYLEIQSASMRIIWQDFLKIE